MTSCSLTGTEFRCTGSGKLEKQDPCTEALSIVIENGIKELAAKCFQRFYNVKTVSLPDSLETIDDSPFTDCNIESITLPKGVKKLNYGQPFDSAKALKEIIVVDDNPYFKAIDGVLFTKDMKTLLLFPTKKNTSFYIVPSSVEVLGWAAFCSTDCIETLILPPTLKTINGAFTIGSMTKNCVFIRYRGREEKPKVLVAAIYRNKNINISYYIIRPPCLTLKCKARQNSGFLLILNVLLLC